MHFHIADDGSGEEYVAELARHASETLQCAVTMTDSGNTGYGRNYNIATQSLHNIYKDTIMLPLEDDWELIRVLNVDPMIKALRDTIFNCIRMGYVGYTQSLMCKFVNHDAQNWLEFSEFSSEPHVFAGHPRLETVEFERLIGPWPEGLGAGATEFEVAHRREARMKVGWPVDLIRPCGDAWVHVGTDHAIDPENVEQKRA